MSLDNILLHKLGEGTKFRIDNEYYDFHHAEINKASNHISYTLIGVNGKLCSLHIHVRIESDPALGLTFDQARKSIESAWFVRPDKNGNYDGYEVKDVSVHLK